MTRAIILSGPPAVGKSTIARRLADIYKMNCVSGGDILKEVAVKEGFAPAGEDWWDTVDGMNFLAMREENFDFDRMIDGQLLRMCRQGDVIITSYTLPWLTSDAIRVWLECSESVSARRLQNRDGVDAEQAHRVARDRYKRNHTLYKNNYGFDFGMDDDIFDVIIHTDGKEISQVITEVVERLDDML
ncbi:MAG: AAA family ATPase [Cenarchaeum sp. SB0665_bin_23]|nr:AAA family ATPase [Cenarchaeum sp. SB0667_bin_13]MXY38027.1 AAA family ATPase [Cenarchaeum sp. SB0664_bin_35]MXY61038.1 AAA family ATPase [Cenarchaeum sp. SB0665_bin_23]MXZ93286.1 AAA family ATPase [Cenarchaeum sp. SB0666_bin_15]MYB47435.1 AAA family ATPase [Cenarchaeum sp. SB0662_bin_33]MYC79192.1 AAA family ATPase [Cenarchaeum sp. SB0661_bin_35]MYD59249.1 AAA family ATPase [Cenarchaeum sp. SB0678_bin_8]MYG33753.1 AAA family ATPase [Cenarchaeum sp. SB0677_bin_16]MYI51306.1 AAA family AT